MKDETRIWLRYAEENLKSAGILLKSHLYNPCLQNVQQCVEKSLKAILIEKSIKLQRTHDILGLRNLLHDKNITVDIDENECDFLNSIFLPSKYPVGSVLADYEPDEQICSDSIKIAEKVFESVNQLLS